MIKHLDKEELEEINDTEPYIIIEYMNNISIGEILFNTLKEDYKLFKDWFIKKQSNNTLVYITENERCEITSFLLLKLEGIKEDYSKMNNPLPPKNRLKISTFKVDDTNIGIGSKFLKIIDLVAHKNNVEEIYITILEKHVELISFLENNNYRYYTYQNTDNDRELVYIKEVL